MEKKKDNFDIIHALDSIVCEHEITVEKANSLADQLTDLISDCNTDEYKVYCFNQIQTLAEILFDYTIKLCKDQKELSAKLDSALELIKR